MGKCGQAAFAVPIALCVVAILAIVAVPAPAVRSSTVAVYPPRNFHPVLAPKSTDVAVVGDSITSWEPAYAGDPAQSWTLTAMQDPLHLAGGWAYPGAQLEAMAAAVTPADVDVLIVMGGTNDMIAGIPIDARLHLVDQIVATIGASTVILSSVAPFNGQATLSVEWNAALAQHAAVRGWTFVDPWAVTRDGDLWMPGTDYGDGVHPSPAAAAAVGQMLHTAIVDAAIAARR